MLGNSSQKLSNELSTVKLSSKNTGMMEWKRFISLTVLLTQSRLTTQADDTNHPIYECRFANHKRLQQVQRSNNNQLRTPFSDKDLESGWYRFDSPEYTRMLEKDDLPKEEFIFRDRGKFFPCGIDTAGKIAASVPDIDPPFTTTYFYALSERHPQYLYESISTTAVACRYQFSTVPFDFNKKPRYPGKECVFSPSVGAFKCYYKLICGPQEQIDIAVRNCGAFYVYYLEPTKIISVTPSLKDALYCAINSTHPMTVSETDNVCMNYVNNTDVTRDWMHYNRNILEIQASCQDNTFPYAWTRFLNGNDTSVIPETCPYNEAGNANRSLLCGTLYGGWMFEQHPTVAEGRVDRKICFSSKSSCSCKASMKISVVNCGNFFIYKRPSLHPLCYSRICTKTVKLPMSNTSSAPATTANATTVIISPTNATSVNSTVATSTIPTTSQPTVPPMENMCNNYVTLTDDSRLFSNSDVSPLCDFFEEKAVRFKSTDGRDLMLKEFCTNTDVNQQFRRFCSSNGISWLTEAHPNVSDNVVYRSVCFSQVIKLPQLFPNPSCTCAKSLMIKVQNCSSFYVYGLPPVVLNSLQDCEARYCTQIIDSARISTTTPPTSSSTDSTPTTKPFDVINFPYQLEGSFQILNPFINFEEVTEEMLSRTESEEYKTLMEICTNILKQALSDETQLQRKITGLRFGSLIADFTISSQNQLDKDDLQTKMQQTLQSALVDRREGSNTFTGSMNAASLQLQDVNECIRSNPCDQNANCINTNTSYRCECKTGYQGNGIFCVVKEEVKTVDDDDDWPNNAIVAVSVVSAFLLIILVFAIFLVVVFLTRYKTTEYEPSKHFRQSGYDNYLDTEKNKEEFKMNMYVAVEPQAATLNSFNPEDEKVGNGHPVKK